MSEAQEPAAAPPPVAPLIPRTLARRVFGVLKGIAVAIALIFFTALVVLLWAFRTGRAVQFVRSDIVRELREQCAIDAELATVELGLFPPELHLGGVVFAKTSTPSASSTVAPARETILSVQEAIVNLAVFPLLYGRLQLSRVAVLQPEATIELAGGKISNLPKCLIPKEEPEEEDAGPSPIVALGISDLRVERGRFRVVMPGTLDLSLEDIGVALAPGASGGSDLSVDFDQSRALLRNRAIPIQRFRLLGHISGPLTNPRALTMQRLELDAARIQLSSAGSIDRIGPVAEARVHLELPLDAIPQLIDGAPEMEGKVVIDTQVAGTIATPRGAGTIVVEKGRIDQFRLFDRLQIDLSADRKRVEISSLEARLDDGRFVAKGRVDLNEKLPLKIDGVLERMSLARVLDQLGVTGSWADFAASGKISAHGTALSPTKINGKVDLELEGFRVLDRGWDHPEVASAPVMLAFGTSRVKGAWSADAKGIAMREVSIDRGGSHAFAEARFNFAEKDGLQIEAVLDRLDFADIGPIAGLMVEGKGKVTGEVGGPYDLITAGGVFDLADAVVGGIPFGAARGRAHWKGGDELEFPDLDGKLGRSAYNGSVLVDFAPKEVELNIDGTISSGRIEDAFVPFGLRSEDYGNAKGDLSGTISLAGPIKTLTGPIELTLAEIDVLGERAETGTVKGALDDGAVVVDSIELDKHGARIFGEGRIDPATGQVNAKVRTKGMTLQRIDTLKAAHEGIDGDLTIRLGVGGTLKAMTGTITAELANTHAGAMQLGGGRVDGKISGGAVDAKGLLFSEQVALEGQVKIDRKLTYRSTIRLTGFDAPKLAASLDRSGPRVRSSAQPPAAERSEAARTPLGEPAQGAQAKRAAGEAREVETGSGWTGVTDAKLELEGSLVEWERSLGRFFVERAVIDGPGIALQSAAPARIALDNGVFDFARLTLIGPNTRLVGSGKIGTRLLDLTIDGRIDLELVQNAFPQVERSGGVLTLNAAVRGSAQDLNLVGTGLIERGFLEWRGLQSRLSAVTANLTFSQSTVLIDRWEGRLDDGRIRGAGQVLLDGYKPSTIALEAALEDVRPRHTYPKFDMSAVGSGELYLEGTPERLNLRGRVDLERATIRPKVDFDVMKTVLNRATQRMLLPEVYDPTSEVMFFDVDLRLLEPLRLKNDTADVELTGEVTMTGSNQRIGFVGALNVLRGRVAAVRSRELTFEAGTVDLADRFRFAPRFDLSLLTRACEAQINLNLVGTIEQWVTTYSSKPEMDETNIVSCLLSGVKTRELETLGGEGAASVAGEVLWGVTGVDRQVRKVIPVDQIDVTTEYSTRQRLYEPRVLVAKEVLEGKVRLEYSSSLLKNDDQRAGFRYRPGWRLAPELQLQGTWTSSQEVPLGDVGLDLKYRWEW